MHIITKRFVLFLWLHNLNFGKSEGCTLADFLNGPLYDRNFDTSDLENSYPLGRTIRVACRNGYTAFFKLICGEEGWIGVGNKCQPKSCGHPGDAQFADFTLVGDDFVFGSQVVYTCQKGYQMFSQKSIRRCMDRGWDGVIPVCQAIKCPVIQVDDNVQVIGDVEEATYGNVIRFSCRSSREVLSASHEIYCNEHGEWSGETPKCKDISCPVPVIANGRVLDNIQEYQQHDILEFECNDKYKAVEERPSICTKLGQRAEWSPTPACEPITCRLLVAVEGTRHDPPFKNVFLPDESVTVTCGDKYYITRPQDTSAVATCKKNGEWDFEPQCKVVICYNPDTRHLKNSRVFLRQNNRLGSTVDYECKTGYRSTDDTNQAKCSRNGWTPNPLCQVITCNGLPTHIQNAYPSNPQQIYYYGQRVNYICEEGYEGGFIIICKENGWRGNPNCKLSTCDKEIIPNTFIENDKPVYRHGDIAEYVCTNGYVGRFSRRCERNYWIGDPRCDELTCNRKDYPNAEIDRNVREVYRYKDVVHYVCKGNYEGRFSLTCEQQGWAGSPQCTAKCNRKDYPNAEIDGNIREVYHYKDVVNYVCKGNYEGRFSLTCEQEGWAGSPQCTECKKPQLEHGFVVGPFNNTLYYTCDENYKLATQGWWGQAQCGSEEIDLAKCIDKNNCGKPPAIPNMKATSPRNNYEHGQNISIICKEGFTAQIEQLTCLKGNWNLNETSLETICVSNGTTCSVPPQVGNAVIESSPQKVYLSGTELKYRCRDDYTMEGNAIITCNNGKWDERIISCAPHNLEQ